MSAATVEQLEMYDASDLQEMFCEYVEHLSEHYLHQGVGWLYYRQQLLCRSEKEAVDPEGLERWGVSHYGLFPNDEILLSPYRGWYSEDRHTVTVSSNQMRIQGPDDIPEHLFQSLLRKFGKDVRILVP